MNKIPHTNKHNKGFSIFETVVYIAMLTVLTVVVMSSLMGLFKSYSVIKVQQDIELSAIQIMDKLTRDIRETTGVVVGQSSFGVPQGALALNVTETSGTDVYSYYSASSTLKVSKNGVYLGDLSQPGVLVNSFTLYQIVGTTTKAIRVELNLQAYPRYGLNPVNKSFYTTVQQRN